MYLSGLQCLLMCCDTGAKAHQETMASVDKQQQHNSTKMRSIFMDCQSGHHSHASLIKMLIKVYTSVSA